MISEVPNHDRLFSGTSWRHARRRRSFTLIELLITVSIIAIMASMVLFAFYAAQEQARVQKTRTLITKLNNIVRARYETYRTRRVPVTFSSGESPADRAKKRLDVLRDLMRMEMPDRWSDVYDDPATPFGAGPKITRPSVCQAYLAKYQAVTGGTVRDPSKEQFQNAECLYMIVMEAVAREGDTRDVFRADDVADTDGDGFPEFVDAWGTPIRYLRWAPGFQSDLQTVASGMPLQVTPNGQSVEVEFNGAKFARSAGNYLGGTLAVLDSTTNQIASNRMVRITGYVHTGAVAKFTGETMTSAGAPFNGTPPSSSDTVLVLGPDPFDSRGIYPQDTLPNADTPTFALYPLIYSAGPDRATGIVSDTTPPMSYSAVNLNPCFVPPPGSLPYGEMMGTHPVSSNEDNFYAGCWNDNIHNHQLNLR